MNRLASFFGQAAQSYVVGYFHKLLFLLLMMPIGGVALVLYQAFSVLPNLPPQEPLVVSCAELLQFGARDKAYVVITDFRLDTTRISTNLLGSKEKWKEAFIPIEASATPHDASAPVQLLLHTEDAICPADLAELESENELHGILVRGTKDLTITQSIRLSSKYGGENTNDRLILQHEMTPATPLQTYGLIVAGVLMTVVGLALWGFVYWLTLPEPAAVATVMEE